MNNCYRSYGNVLDSKEVHVCDIFINYYRKHFHSPLSLYKEERLGYVRNPRSLMEGTETLCRDDIGDLPGSPEHLWLRENANEIG